MTRRERDHLLEGLIAGDLSAADGIRIEAELTVNPSTRQDYYDRLALTALLETEAAAEAEVISLPPVSTWRHWRWALSSLAAVVALAFASLGGDLSHRNNSPPLPKVSEQKAQGFGLLVGQSETIWTNRTALTDGVLLPSGPLQLESGVAQIELFSGVSLVVEGAADFEVISAMEMIVSSGRIRARVPEAAHGFRIHSPAGQVVDLSTEFALNVTAEGSELHVFDGEVEWHPEASALRRLQQGQALGWHAAGHLTDLTADETNFIGVDEFTARLTSKRLGRRAEWLEFSAKLQADPRLLAYYRMASPQQWSRRLVNRAVDSQIGEGAVVGAARATDRWGTPGEALDFSPTGSRVRVVVPGTYRSLTLMTWVKINSLDRWYNSLFLTDGHDLNEPHWQIMDDGRMFFSVKKRDKVDASSGEKSKYEFYSPSFWHPSLSGRWLMIATVYDVDAARVTHYLNGKILSREAVPENYLVETVAIGAASIGNWDLPVREDTDFAVRNLNGSMDEFALFSSALSDAEIAEIYQYGKP